MQHKSISNLHEILFKQRTDMSVSVSVVKLHTYIIDLGITLRKSIRNIEMKLFSKDSAKTLLQWV